MRGVSLSAMVTKKSRAKKLYIFSNLTGLQISKQLNIAPQTLTRWRKKYGWKELRQQRIYNQQSSPPLTFNDTHNQILIDLRNYTRLHYPDVAPLMDFTIKEFRKHINEQ